MHLDELAAEVVRRARMAGADEADAVAEESEELTVTVRMGVAEQLKRSRERRLGVRVLVGRSTAVASTADVVPPAIERLAADAVALARVTAPDANAGLPPPEALARTVPELDLYDPAVEGIEPAGAMEIARRAEQAAREADARITNSEGAQFSCQAVAHGYASSHGFTGRYRGSYFALSVTPVAKAEGSMQRAYWYAASRHLDRLETPEQVGKTAAQRALARLGARPIRTCTCPVVFDAEAAGCLLGHVAAAVSGPRLYKGASFLAGKLGKVIASPSVTIIDDGRRPAGLASAPFDGEGTPRRRTVVVESGTLASYLLDAYAARRLGLSPTGNAQRSVHAPPAAGPTNFFLAPGPHSPAEVIASVSEGLYVTELLGFGVNGVTGDYSQGVAGQWIVGGELAFPVEEITVAGNLVSMLADIEMVADELAFRTPVAAPTLKIARMTVAGT